MAPRHESGNPRLVEQPKTIQHEGDKAPAGTGQAGREAQPPGSAKQRQKAPPKEDPRRPPADAPRPGTGKPDKQEGVGTIQRDNK